MAVQAGDGHSNRGGDKVQAREQCRPAKSYAAGALVQAALNAMAVSAPSSEPMAASGYLLAPAAPVAAIIAVQVRVQNLPSSTCRDMPCFHILPPVKKRENQDAV